MNTGCIICGKFCEARMMLCEECIENARKWKEIDDSMTLCLDDIDDFRMKGFKYMRTV